MKTIDKLQQILNKPVQIHGSTYKYECKPIADRIVCGDGSTMSVQASENHYCTPRSNTGPYTHVEVWCLIGSTLPIVEFEYDDEEPSAQVDINAVVEYIDNRGGIKTTLPLE